MANGSSLGADVLFFLLGGRALGGGRGDEIYPLPDISRLHVLVVSPRDIHVPTLEAYRWLKASGYDVTYVRNITDIDDKIIAASKETGEPIDAITDKFAKIYNTDMAALGAGGGQMNCS